MISGPLGDDLAGQMERVGFFKFSLYLGQLVNIEEGDLREAAQPWIDIAWNPKVHHHSSSRGEEGWGDEIVGGFRAKDSEIVLYPAGELVPGQESFCGHEDGCRAVTEGNLRYPSLLKSGENLLVDLGSPYE